MKKAKHHRIYKAVRNYLLNELGVTKEYIDQLVEDKVNKRIDHLSNTSMSENVLDRKIKEAVRKMITDDIMWEIRGKARQEILKNINVKFEGSVSFDGKRLGMQIPGLLVKLEEGNGNEG